MNIRQKINAVMKIVEYVKRDADVSTGGSSYKAVTHDAVLAAVRPELVAQGITIEPELKEHQWFEPRKGKEKSTMWLYEAVFDVYFVNIDDPEDRIKTTVSGHANDSGDKAAGKALSYAVKNAMLKVFAIETGINDESRNFDPSEFTEEQKAIFDDLLTSKKAQQFYCYSLLLPDPIRIGLHNSFAPGEKSKMKQLCREMETEGIKATESTVVEIQKLIDAQDPAVLEVTDELEPYEKIVISKRLRDGDVKYIQNLQQGVA